MNIYQYSEKMHETHLNRFLTLLIILSFSILKAYAIGGNGTYYAIVDAAVSSNSTGYGTVYVNDNGGETDDPSKYSDTSQGGMDTKTSGGYVSVTAFAKPNSGYHFFGWSSSNNSRTLINNNTAKNEKYTATYQAATSKKIANGQHHKIFAVFDINTLTINANNLAASENAIFTVTNNSDSNIKYTVATNKNISGGKAVTIQYIPSGTYTVAVTGWTYTRTPKPSSQSSVKVPDDTVINFTFPSESVSKKHTESKLSYPK